MAAKAYDALRHVLDLLHIPVIATWRALDFMGTDEEGFYGSPGLQAPRYSNIILQNSDLLIVLGSRLDNMITAFNEEHFAYKAKKIIVDIDENEMKKLNMPDKYMIHSDVGEFVNVLCEQLDKWSLEEKDIFNRQIGKWLEVCRTLKDKYPITKEKQENKALATDFDDVSKQKAVNLYSVTEAISECAESDDTIVISSTSRCNTAGHIAFNH